jgi:hypothetical protein
MFTIQAFLMVLALVMFLLATIKVPEHPRCSYGWLGAFCALLSFMLK